MISVALLSCNESIHDKLKVLSQVQRFVDPANTDPSNHHIIPDHTVIVYGGIELLDAYFLLVLIGCHRYHNRSYRNGMR